MKQMRLIYGSPTVGKTTLIAQLRKEGLTVADTDEGLTSITVRAGQANLKKLIAESNSIDVLFTNLYPVDDHLKSLYARYMTHAFARRRGSLWLHMVKRDADAKQGEALADHGLTEAIVRDWEKGIHDKWMTEFAEWGVKTRILNDFEYLSKSLIT